MDMKKRCVAITAFLGFIIMLLVPGVSSPGGAWAAKGEKQVKSGGDVEKAPDFILRNLAGRQIRLSDYQGKVVLLVFSTTWCPHCLKATEYMKELYRRYNARGLKILNIDINESRRKVTSYAKKYQIPYTVLLDSGAVARDYRVFGVPTLMLIDGDRNIVCRRCPSIENLIEKLLPS